MKTRRITTILMILVLTLANFSFVFASPEGQTPEENETQAESMFNNKQGETVDPGLHDVSLDDASNWVEKKGFELVLFLQRFIQPFAIIVFIISGIMALVGSFGNGRLTSRGLWGMFVALIVYAVVLYAPEIMDAWMNWIRS